MKRDESLRLYEESQRTKTIFKVMMTKQGKSLKIGGKTHTESNFDEETSILMTKLEIPKIRDKRRLLMGATNYEISMIAMNPSLKAIRKCWTEHPH